MLEKVHMVALKRIKISDAEIQVRLRLAALEPDRQAILASALPLIEKQVDSIVEKFYSVQLSIDEVVVFLDDPDTLARLKQAQRQYILDLFSGQYDGVYVINRLRIGMIHRNIGVEPKLYISAINALKTILFEALDHAIESDEKLVAVKTALDRLLYFDTTLVFDSYIDSMISETEKAWRKTEEYASSLEQKVAERTAQLEELAKLDSLTRLYNQGSMREFSTKILASVQRRNSLLSLIYLDVDDFKEINDKHGHLEGDEVLKSIAKMIAENIRESDIACRYGGDEFCVVFPDSGIKDARIVCERILQTFSRQFPDYSLSMGVAQTGPEIYLSVDELIALADKRMYKAKTVDGSHIEG